MSLKHFLNSIWAGVAHLWNALTEGAKKYAPIAISVLEKIKNFEDSGCADVITALIPSGIDDQINAKIKEWLPGVIINTQLVGSVANITDPNEQLRAILNALKVAPDETKKLYYHGLASLILEKVSDGKFDWNDSIAVSQYYFKHIHQAQEAEAN